MPSGVYTRNKTKSRLGQNQLEMIGQKFGRLLVLNYDTKVSEQTRKAHYVVRCDCGKEFVQGENFLRTGHAKSCGCLRRDSMQQVGKTTNRSGENNPNYLFGITKEQNKFRKSVNIRDKVCQYNDGSECKGQLEAHHLDGNNWNNVLNNGVLLCHHHHKIITCAGNQWRPNYDDCRLVDVS